jgi:hypothetical protein
MRCEIVASIVKAIDWPDARVTPVYMPNFSHGCAGISYALARAGHALNRPDLVDVATAGATRLLDLGARSDESILVPHSVPTRNPDFHSPTAGAMGPLGRALAGTPSSGAAVKPSVGVVYRPDSGPASGTTWGSAAGRLGSAKWHWMPIRRLRTGSGSTGRTS